MVKILTILLFPLLSFSQANRFAGFGHNPASCASDADAAAWIAASGISDPVLCGAVNALVISYKSNSIWTKRKAIYIFVGGTAAKVKFNLKDPRDLDAAFRLVPSGGITYATTGTTFNGTTGYFNTFLNPTSHLTQYNTSIGFFALSNVSENGWDMAAYTNSGASDAGYPVVGLRVRYGGDDKGRYYCYGGYAAADVALAAVNTNCIGLTTGSRVTSTDNRIFFNGTQTGTTNTTTATSTLPNYNIFIGAANVNGSAASFTSKKVMAVFIGDGVNTTEAANEYTIWSTFRTTMGL